MNSYFAIYRIDSDGCKFHVCSFRTNEEAQKALDKYTKEYKIWIDLENQVLKLSRTINWENHTDEQYDSFVEDIIKDNKQIYYKFKSKGFRGCISPENLFIREIVFYNNDEILK